MGECYAAHARRPAAADSSDSDASRGEPLWIVKPVHQSRGRGIRLVSQYDEILPEEEDLSLIQRYIERPLLIGGIKSDLRLYVFVTGLSPLRIYMHDGGLVRFALEPYVSADLGSGAEEEEAAAATPQYQSDGTAAANREEVQKGQSLRSVRTQQSLRELASQGCFLRDCL